MTCASCVGRVERVLKAQLVWFRPRQPRNAQVSVQPGAVKAYVRRSVRGCYGT
ncbi:MAG: hypothetical protein DI533_02355 [Cereibacter sphaeroides]|uniref:Uncharacterized protein n=1 Tax=Cereibacter sphaeroides TaxID=1063 RepID=A0A2W5U7Z0_CERSP|nr:MAG: hypothetical protein DI533_02355 [Cereibacter sphaeroides]